jgi:phage terminase large subunit
LQYKVIDVERNKKLTSVVSETFPHLKKGAFRDFEAIIRDMGGQLTRENFNKSEHIYKDVLEFFSADSGKAHGPGRADLFLNEIQNIPYETAFHLMQRTENEIILDYNPTHSFWIDEMYLDNPKKTNGKDYVLIHSTIFDNPYVSDNIKRMVLDRAEIDENYRRVYLEGQTGSLEGLVFDEINLIDEMPSECKWVAYGMDFGFTNHPTTVIQVKLSGGELYLDELVYERGLVGVPNPLGKPNIIDRFRENNITTRDEIIGDSEDMKTITELGYHKYYVLAVRKPAGSVREGIDIMKRFRINVTKNSINLIKEFRNYRWKDEKDQTRTNQKKNEPVKDYDHGIDAVRYVCYEKLRDGFQGQIKGTRI